MTKREFLEFKGWTLEEGMRRMRGYMTECWKENLDCKISNYEVFCDYPFHELNQVYNEYYHADNDIGSTYDWLEMTATDEIISKYLRKNDDSLLLERLTNRVIKWEESLESIHAWHLAYKDNLNEEEECDVLYEDENFCLVRETLREITNNPKLWEC